MRSHTISPRTAERSKVFKSLTVTCPLHFWQNDRGLLSVTAVTQGWNGNETKSQHRKLILEKKILIISSGFFPVLGSPALTTTTTLCSQCTSAGSQVAESHSLEHCWHWQSIVVMAAEKAK